MDCKHNTVTVYTAQPDSIVARLMERGRHYAKLALIAEKYGEAGAVFLRAYEWYVHSAQQIVPRPPEAESAVWTFRNPRYMERHPGHRVLALRVPAGQAVFFRMRDWNQILNLRFIGETEEEEAAFADRLARQGVRYEGDIYTTPFYPLLKKELLHSWSRLFRYDPQIKQGAEPPYPDMQAGLWYIDRDWVIPDLP